MMIPLISQILVAGTTSLRRLRTPGHRLTLSLAIAASLGLGGLLLLDSNPVYASDKLSALEVRELMQQGKIQPLLQLIKQHDFPGHLLDAELEREKGRLIYELEYLNDKGEVWEYELDAETGEILEQEREE